jgi:hypothetical protein
VSAKPLITRAVASLWKTFYQLVSDIESEAEEMVKNKNQGRATRRGVMPAQASMVFGRSPTRW